MVVVIVPALAKGKERDPPVVPARVRGLEPAGAEQVAGGVDEEGAVVDGDGGDYEAPHQAGQPAGEVAADGDEDDGDPVEPVEQSQLRVFLPVLHSLPVGERLVPVEHPADVAPPHTA